MTEPSPPPEPTPPPATSVDRRRVLLYALAGVSLAAGGTIGYDLYRERKNSAGERALDEARAKLPSIPEDRVGYTDSAASMSGRRTLGRTGLRVSLVSIGAGSLGAPDTVLRAVDRGFNYIDTSTCYGSSELVIGRALKMRPSARDNLIIATKWDPGFDTPKERMLESLDESLRRMNVDYVDIMQLHWLGGGHKPNDTGFNRLDNTELYEAMAEAKRAGKVRFFGATSHDSNRGKILEHAIDKGAFDMLLVKANVLDYESAGIPELLAKAKSSHVGVVIMKSQPGGGKVPMGFEKSRYDVFQANLRWALALDCASVVASAIGTDERAQELAIGAVQEKFGLRDAELLDRYAAALSPDYCRGCAGGCHDACPDGVAIAPVLQFAMYHDEYRWPERARAHYRALPVEQRWSERCTSCTQCTDACPYGVRAHERVQHARNHLA